MGFDRLTLQRPRSCLGKGQWYDVLNKGRFTLEQGPIFDHQL